MHRNEARASGADRGATGRQSLNYLRQRSMHRVWWKPARVVARRGHSGEPPHQPKSNLTIGKRV